MQTLLEYFTRPIVAAAIKRKWFSKPVLPFRRYLVRYQEAFEMGIGIGYAYRHNLVWVVQFFCEKGREIELTQAMRKIAQRQLSELPNAATLFDLGVSYEEYRYRIAVSSKMRLKTSSYLSAEGWDKWMDRLEVPFDKASVDIQTAMSYGIALGGAFPEKAEQLWSHQHRRLSDKEKEDLRRMRGYGLDIPAEMPTPLSFQQFSEQMHSFMETYVAENHPDILPSK